MHERYLHTVHEGYIPTMGEGYISTMGERHIPTMGERHIPTRVYLQVRDTYQGVPTGEGYPPWYSLVYTHPGIAWYIHPVYPPWYTLPGTPCYTHGSVPTSAARAVHGRRVPGLIPEINNKERENEAHREASPP